MHLSRYLKIYPAKNLPDHFMLFSTAQLSMATVSAELLQRAGENRLTSQELETLTRLAMVVPDPAVEKERMRGILERKNGQSRNFMAMVVLNLDCNLNCGYCYEGDFRGGRYMSEDTADLLAETLLRDRIANGFDLTVAFYGGEPLLSTGLIRRISEPLQRAARERGVKYGFSLVTNGTLFNRQAVLELLPLGLKGAKLTLDGPRQVHDRERPYASGAGSFDVIVENLAETCDLIPIQLGGNFRKDNYREFPFLLDELVSRGITPEKLQHVLFTPVSPKSGCADLDSGCAAPGEPWLVEAQLFLRGEILSRGFRTTKPTASACIVELENTLVVDCDGGYFKCPAFMGWPDLCVGNLTEGIKDYSASHCLGAWQVDECLDCAYLPLCFGGCRYLNLVTGKGMAALGCRREFLDAALEEILLQNIAYRTVLQGAPGPKGSGCPSAKVNGVPASTSC